MHFTDARFHEKITFAGLEFTASWEKLISELEALIFTIWLSWGDPSGRKSTDRGVMGQVRVRAVREKSDE